VEVAAKVASILIGAGASRLVELEKQTRRRFYLVGKEDTHLDHFVVLAEGKREELAPPAPVAEGAKIQLTLGEVGLHDPEAGVGKVESFDVCVAGAAKLVGKKVNVQIERVLDGAAYATLVAKTSDVEEPITAEGEAEKPTRRAPAKKADAGSDVESDVEAVAEEPEEPEELEEPEEAEAIEQPKPATAPKKKTRRGSRGGRGRKKSATTAAAAGAAENGAPPAAAKIHVPDRELGAPEPAEEEQPADEQPSQDGAETPKPKKKTRRGTRGGRGRKKKTAAAPAAVAAAEPASDAPPAEAPTSDWEYVPMSEWGDEVPPGQ
jgi:predicted RNA-binding protein with TRAM domain